MERTAHISLPMAIIIGINAIVGATIFIAPAALITIAGPAALITYVIVSFAALFLGLSLARVAQLYPSKEVFYTYAHAWGGHLWGTLATTSYCLGLIIALGLLTLVTSSYLQAYSTLPTNIIACLLTLVIVLANVMGASIARTGQIILMLLTYIPIVLIVGLCAANARLENLIPFMPHGLQSIFQAIPIVIFGFFGMEAIPSLFNEIKNPQENVPKAIIATVILVALTYITFAGAIFLGIPQKLFVSETTQLASALLVVYPQLTWLTNLINWAIIITIIGTLHAMTWSVASLLSHTSHIISPKALSHTQAVISIGIAIIAICNLVSNISTMFNLTALFIIFTYATAIILLLLKPKGRNGYQIIITTLGLGSSLIIFGCAVWSLISA